MYYGAGIILAIVGTLSVLNISKKMDFLSNNVKSIFTTLGKNSLIIYGVHLSLIQTIGVPAFNEDVLMYFILNLVVISTIAVITVIVNRYAKFLMGKF